MEIRQLITFLQVASLQNFTQAARNLGYSQSNISAQIQQLESEVGAPLFNRIGRGVSLTQHGEQLIPYAQKIVSTAIQMENFLKSQDSLGGTIRIGIVESLFQPLLEPAVHQFHTLFPHVRIEIIVDGTATLKNDLKKGLLDAACLIDSKLSNIQWSIWHEMCVPIVIVANPLHPLAGREDLSLQALKDEEFILMEESASYSSHFQQAMLEKNSAFAPFLRLQSAEKALALVQQGPYFSVLPSYTVDQSVKAGTSTAVKLSDYTLSQYVQIVLHSGKILTPQVSGFLRILRTALTDLIGPSSEIRQ